MNNELWDKILQFDFDNPPSEYGFTIRLAKENFWTKDFTQQAILEYKKFMYLAATSEFMVSPSEVVDMVWHQHLIFTQSYKEFCNLIGKQVQHIPSTHNKEDFQKFKQAKERTNKFYTDAFGEQPKCLWDYNTMYESLNLEKAKYKIRTFVIVGILAFIALIIPFYFLLRPIYVNIGNPFFIFYFIIIACATFLGLELYNRRKLRQIINEFDKRCFIYNLQPFELIYLKTQKLSTVINGTINEFIDNQTLQVNADSTIEIIKNSSSNSIEQLQAITTLSELGKTFYPILLRQLIAKPIFGNIANCMDAFKKYFNKSRKFSNLFYLNFGALAVLLMLGFIRLTTGLLRDKPVANIAGVVLILTILIILYLNRLTTLVCINTIPGLYKNEILPTKQIEGNWQWNYFLFGTAVLATAFAPIVNNIERNNSNSSDSGGGNCGTSCGSSCGSCGGCGGD